MAEICQRVLDESGLPVNLDLGIVVPIFKGRVKSGTASIIEL